MRPMFEYIKKINTKKSLIGIEIGVAKGDNAKDILMNLPIQKIYLIDSYKTYVEKNIITRANYDAEFLLKAKINLAKYSNQIEFIVKKSIDAVNDILVDVDFIYIDGSHKYKDVKKDIELYYPVLKEDGVIGGHDFDSPNIFLAVLLFLFKKKLFKTFHFKKHDWWINR